ncbi:MAG: replication-associated recombination protein A [Eubacteriaceae bacterium]|jgi:putative ATPase
MQQNFFTQNYEEQIKSRAPLAVRMRPETLDEFIGQGQIVGPGRLINRLIKADRLSSAVFYGPPGTGKTTLAKIIAKTTKADFYEINAVTSGKKEMTEVLEKARNSLSVYGKRSIMFIDEIHRFNKAQQDLLLPSVEEGLVILIGATTENPYFEINSPLLSRSTVFEFQNLTDEQVVAILKRAIADKERGFGLMKVEAEPEALEHLARIAGGDARRALNALELAVLTKDKDDAGIIRIDLATAQECIQKKAVVYDKKGDSHYDTISAFIKSIRGSDPDAGLFWLAKMLEAGEDPRFIARRLVILASEDIGNAEPMGLPVAVAAAQAVDMIGLPEAQLNLAQAVTFLANAPKSNASYMGLSAAQKAVRHDSDGQVPAHLKDAHYSGAPKMGRGIEYKYPHNYPGSWIPQNYLPDDIRDARFYYPTENGKEEEARERLEEHLTARENARQKKAAGRVPGKTRTGTEQSAQTKAPAGKAEQQGKE